MDSIKLIVPRNIVLRHGQHPELYGESIAELENGMVTDVYTDENGLLFTITNDNDLIEYLDRIPNTDNIITLSDSEIHLKTLMMTDLNTLHQWLSLSPFYRYDLLEDSKRITLEFISKANTLLSHLFIISKEHSLGTISYSIIDKVAVLDFCIYEHKDILDNELDLILKMIIEHLKSKYKILSIVSLVFDFDLRIAEAFNRCGFKKKRKPVVYPTITGHQASFEFEMKIK